MTRLPVVSDTEQSDTVRRDGCCCSEDCCDSPDIESMAGSCEHDECFCDDNWSRQCRNCGAICRCDV